MNEDIKQYDFDSDFQELILACWIKHPDKFLAYGPIMHPRSFSGVQATLLAQAVHGYFTKTGQFPSWRVSKQLFLDEAKRLESSENDSTEFFEKIRRIDTRDADAVVERVRDFVRERAVLAAVRKTIEDIQENKKLDIVKLFEDAISIGQNLDDLGYVLHDDIDRVVDKVTARGYGIKTGITMLDNVVWRHGLMPGWLIVPLAPPKRYKTMFCINVAMHVIGPTIGKNVFYYSCEISQELAMTRALSNLTGMSQEYMFENPEEFKRAANRQKKQHVSGYLVIKGFPAGTTTISDIRAHATAVCQQHGIVPHLIIIDYAETVLPAVRKHQDHREQADIYTDARALGAKFNCPVIMPDRCNAETVDKSVPNMRSFQGAFQKAGIVDGAIGLCATDAEYKMNVLRGFIFINRHGKAYQHFRGTVDPDSVQLQFNEEIPYEPEDGMVEQRSRRKRPSMPSDLQEQ